MPLFPSERGYLESFRGRIALNTNLQNTRQWCGGIRITLVLPDSWQHFPQFHSSRPFPREPTIVPSQTTVLIHFAHSHALKTQLGSKWPRENTLSAGRGYAPDKAGSRNRERPGSMSRLRLFPGEPPERKRALETEI